MRCLLAFLDPLLRRASPIIEPHYRPAGQAQVGNDKTGSREQLAGMVLDLGHDRLGFVQLPARYAKLW